jgi:hypothetical protein
MPAIFISFLPLLPTPPPVARYLYALHSSPTPSTETGLTSPQSFVPHQSIHSPPKTNQSTLPTNSSSILLTSLLNASTSLQQSNGLRSFNLKHPTTASLALCTSFGKSFNFFRSPSFCFRTSISERTDCVDVDVSDFKEDELEDEEISGEERRSFCNSARRRDSAAWILESSAATRCWMCRSRVLARVEFV